MAKVSAKQLQEANVRLNTEITVLGMYLTDTALKEVSPSACVGWSNGHKLDKVKGTVKLYRATAAHGGYVVITGYGCVGGDSVQIHYLDDAYKNKSDWFLNNYPLQEAIDKVWLIRNNLMRTAAGLK
jgi:hypothetical protein